MTFDKNRHHRRSIRLPGYDYRRPGAYFVTLVAANRECLFQHQDLLWVVEQCWLAIPHDFTHASLDAWIAMPNHLHGILVLDAGVATRPDDQLSQAGSLQAGSLGAIVGNFKSITTRRINRIRGTTGVPVWQRNYYDRIVRDERELERVREYIAANPSRWMCDRENPQQAHERDDWTDDEDRWFGVQP